MRILLTHSLLASTFLCAGCRDDGMSSSSQPSEGTGRTNRDYGLVVTLDGQQLGLHALGEGPQDLETWPWSELRSRDIRAISVSRSGRYVAAVAGSRRPAIAYSVLDQQALAVPVPSDGLARVLWSSNENRFCAIYADGTVRSVRVANGELTEDRKGHLPREVDVKRVRDCFLVSDIVGVNHWDGDTILYSLFDGSSRTMPAPRTLAGGDHLFYQIGPQLYRSDLDGSNQTLICAPTVAYAFANGFRVRKDGKYVLYDQPRRSGPGFEIVLVDVATGRSHHLSSSSIDLRTAVDWFATEPDIKPATVGTSSRGRRESTSVPSSTREN